MSIDLLGTATGMAADLISGIIGNGTPDPIAASKAKREARFAELLAEQEEAKKALEEVAGGGIEGYWQWKIKKLREQIEEQVMGEMNMTAEKLAALSLEDRLALEKKISEVVEQRLKLAMDEEMKRRKREAMGLTASTTAMLSAQEISSA